MQLDKIGFIGLGLIGGSIALKIKKDHPDTSIIATAGRESTVKTAHSMGLIDNDTLLTMEDFKDCDFIFLCAPVEKNIEHLSLLKDIIKPDCIITDVGSTKTEIHKEVIRLQLEDNFIGGHPMTGSEKTGIEFADPLLLENAYYIITPTDKSTEDNIQSYKEFVSSLGSIPLIMEYTAHDHATASISHLPHIISYALANLVEDIDDSNETMKTIAAGGFRDMTRIAASSPVMWESICISNREQILELSDKYIAELKKIRDMISKSDKQGMLDYFQKAKDYRDSLAVPTHRNVTDIHEIYVDLADETGGIAIIANLLAFKGINIKNIGIINNREFEEGVLRIEFYDQDALKLAKVVLEEKMYKLYDR